MHILEKKINQFCTKFAHFLVFLFISDGEVYLWKQLWKLKKLQKLINYEKRFAYFSAKRLAFEDWKQAYVRNCTALSVSEQNNA